MEKKIFIVYMPYVAAKLREEGFLFLGTGINQKKPQYFTYLFEDTPQLRQAFERIIAEKKKR